MKTTAKTKNKRNPKPLRKACKPEKITSKELQQELQKGRNEDKKKEELLIKTYLKNP